MVTLEHFKELQRRYQPETVDFEYNTGYLMQATRNGTYIHTEDETAVIYTKKAADEGSQFVIVAAAGKDRSGLIMSAARSLSMMCPEAVIIKNVGEDLEPDLKCAGCSEYGCGDMWDSYAKYDDNTYPQLIVDAEECAGLKGSKYTRLREEMNRCKRDYSIDVVEYDDESAFDRLLDMWADRLAKSNGIDKAEIKRSHEMFRPVRDEFFQHCVRDADTGAVIGFLSFSEISKNCLGFNALINDFSYRNLYRLMMFEGIKIADRLGYHYVNLQGSEDEAQYKSKLRFKPGIVISKKHLVYCG